MSGDIVTNLSCYNGGTLTSGHKGGSHIKALLLSTYETFHLPPEVPGGQILGDEFIQFKS